MLISVRRFLNYILRYEVRLYTVGRCYSNENATEWTFNKRSRLSTSGYDR